MTVSELEDRMSYEELIEWHTIFSLEAEEAKKASQKAQAKAKHNKNRL